MLVPFNKKLYFSGIDCRSENVRWICVVISTNRDRITCIQSSVNKLSNKLGPYIYSVAVAIAYIRIRCFFFFCVSIIIDDDECDTASNTIWNYDFLLEFVWCFEPVTTGASDFHTKVFLHSAHQLKSNHLFISLCCRSGKKQNKTRTMNYNKVMNERTGR